MARGISKRTLGLLATLVLQALLIEKICKSLFDLTTVELPGGFVCYSEVFFIGRIYKNYITPNRRCVE